MARRGNSQLSRIYVDDLADVADAFDAVDVLWTRLLSWCRQPYISKADRDSLSDELRRIERGLETTRKWLVDNLEREEGNGKK